MATKPKLSDATPRPWKRSCFLIQGPNGDWVAHTGMGNLPPSRSHESEANAALIVAAVNSYSPAREAAWQAVVEGLRHALTTKHDIQTCACVPCEDARSALPKETLCR